MRLRPQRMASASDQSGGGGGGGGGAGAGGGGVFDNFTDSFLNAFSKVHKPDRRFIEVREKADKLDEDLSHVEKIVARVARREGDLESDYVDLANQFRKLVDLEAGLDEPLHAFAAGVEKSSQGFKSLREHTDQNYFGSLRDMQSYIGSLKSLLKSREQKQLDFEALSDYLAKAAADRDMLASAHHHHQHGSSSSSYGGPTGFLRSKIEDVRGVDHEQARRERVRKLELRIDDLTREVEAAKKTTEAFDEEVVREVADFERIKAVEFRDTLGALADAHTTFYRDTIRHWEAFLTGMDD